MVFPRSAALLIGAILTLAACQVGEQPSGLTTDGLALADGGKVWICHFPGHAEKGEGARTDTVTSEPSGNISPCPGANIIEVSTLACSNGHGISEEQCALGTH